MHQPHKTHARTPPYRRERLQVQRKHFAHHNLRLALGALREDGQIATEADAQQRPVAGVRAAQQTFAGQLQFVAEEAGHEDLHDHAAQEDDVERVAGGIVARRRLFEQI